MMRHAPSAAMPTVAHIAGTRTDERVAPTVLLAPFGRITLRTAEADQKGEHDI